MMIEVRQCRAQDFEQVVGLLTQLWPDQPLDAAPLRHVFNRALESDSQVYSCAIDGQRSIGFASLCFKNSLWQQGYLGHVDELVVDQAFRGQGVGSRLLECIIAAAPQRGCRRLELDSAFHRIDAHSFYERQGFEKRAYLFSKHL